MSVAPLIVGLGGTPRTGSTTERCLRLALARAETLGCRTVCLAGPDLPQALYGAAEPWDHRTPQALALVDALRQADGLIVATPSYHGSISGLLKNALDYAEDLRTDERPYLQDRAVGIIACAEGAQALGSTLVAVRSVVHALRGWPTPYGAAISTAAKPFGSDGQVQDATVQRACDTVAEEVVRFAQRWRVA